MVIGLFFSFAAWSQSLRVSGFVRDADSKEALIGACITNNRTDVVVFSNSAGFYSLWLPTTDSVDISFAYLAYQPQTYRMVAADSVQPTVYLQPNKHILHSVEVHADHSPTLKTEMSTLSMPIEQIKELPAIIGEPDILRSFQLMPGVQGGKEGTSGIYVRGGSPDQNLFLLDGVALYNVNHIGGFLSTFDPNAINSVKLYKGGFPARYGGRLSSVVDMQMKDGNKQQLQGEFFMGLLASKLSLEGPLRKDTSSFFVSLRRCNVDIFTRPVALLSTQGETMTGYTFYDFYAKYNTILSAKGRFSLSAYQGRDKVFITTNDKADTPLESSLKAKDHTKWGNLMFSAQYTHLFSPKVFASFMAAYTQYRYKKLLDVRIAEAGSQVYSDKSLYQLVSGVRDFSFGADVDIYASQRHTFRVGTRGVAHSFRPGKSKYQGFFDNYASPDAVDVSAWEGDMYVQDEWHISPILALNIGIRGTLYAVEGRSFSALQPRCNMFYRFYKDYALKASYSFMNQPLHMVSTYNTAIPSDVWLPATALLQPEQAHQYSLGIFKDFSWQGQQISFSAEAYYKRMQHLIDYKESVSYFSSGAQWQEKAEPKGEADIYGVELMLKKSSGRTTALLAYTWSKNERQFAHINQGLPYPYRYDRRHDISAVLTHHFTDDISLSATWVYNTGIAISMAQAHYSLIESSVDYEPGLFDAHIYGRKNSYRMPAFHKLDISASFSKQKAKGVRTWTVGVYNAYARQNAFYLFYKEKDGKRQLYQFSLFPFFPSVSYSYKF